MQISPLSNIYFKSKRNDRNQIKKLSTSTDPIGLNARQNIDSAIENLSKDSTDESIRFLLSTAQSLAYGIPANSELRKKLLEKSPLKGNPQLANTDWELKLKNAAQTAISQNQSPEKETLEKLFEKTFQKPTRLSPNEQIILNERNKILSYLKLTSTEDIDHAQNIKKNLDYFIFSSEISMHDKTKCLEKIAYFLSPEYKINPLLKDKKLQALDEILNDLIIKTPEEAALTIKDVNQKRHGMCAAISACRKLLAYFDKQNYLDNIFEELNDSPYMKIYDITELGSGKKIQVKKIDIDFNHALNENYRIIDASALQWMQIAGRTADGNHTITNYTSFDKNNYEIYADSFWISNLPEEMENIHTVLKSTIIAKKLAKEINRKKAAIKTLKLDAQRLEKSIIQDLQKYNLELEASLKKLFPQKPNSEIKHISSRILKLHEGNEYVPSTNYKKETTENPKFIIHENEPEETKKEKLKNFLIESIGADKKQAEEEIEKIFPVYDFIFSDIQQLNGIKKHKIPTAKAKYFNILFKFSTAYQDALEANLNDPSQVSANLNVHNLANRTQRTKKHFERIIEFLEKHHLADSELAEILETEKNDYKSLLNAMRKYSAKYDFILQQRENEISQLFGFKDKKDMILALLRAYKENIKTNDKEEIALLSQVYKINPTKFAALKKLDKLISEIETNTYKGNPENILDDFQIKDNIDFWIFISNSLASYLAEPSILKAQQKPMYFFTKNIVKKASDWTMLSNNLKLAETKIMELEQFMIDVEEKFNVPTGKDEILDFHRKNGEILNEDEFELLNKKFKSIRIFEDLKNETTERIKIPEVYLFGAAELEILHRAEKNFTKAERYVNKLYNAINRAYAPDLEKIYNDIGRKSGHFWVGEEGSSGLYDSQEIKILEQMTGKRFYIEEDLLPAIEKLKQGIGGGQINTNVSDTELSGHAQFTPGISTLPLIEKKSKEVKDTDIIWHDNSWGRMERKSTWTDESGQTRTDYNSNLGGRDGYILSNTDTIGWDLEYAMYGKGIHKKNILDNPIEKKYYSHLGTEYPLFSSILLPNNTSSTKASSIKLANSLMSANANKRTLARLLKEIEKGNIPNYKIYGEKIDEFVNVQAKTILETLEKIKTTEDFKNLPENHEIKIIFKKIALLNSPFGNENETYINTIKTPEEIKEYNEKILSKLKLFTKGYLEKNAFLLKNDTIKDAFLDYLYDFSTEKKYNLSQLKKNISKALRPQENEITNDKTLKEIVIEKISKTVDENVKHTSYKKILKKELITLFNTYYNDTYDTTLLLKNEDFAPIVSFIDKKFEPKDDAELLAIINNLRKQDNSEINKLLNSASLEDFGINIIPEEHYFKLLKANNYSAEYKLNSAIFSHFIENFFPEKEQKKVTLGNNYDKIKLSNYTSADALYRTLHVTLSHLEIQKLINKRKTEYLQKYKVRPAVPEVQYYNNTIVAETIEKNLEKIKNIIDSYKADTAAETLLLKIKEFKTALAKQDLTDEYYHETIYPIIKDIFDTQVPGYLGPKNANLLTLLLNSKNKSLDEIIEYLHEFYEGLKEIEPDFNKEKIAESKKYKINACKKLSQSIIVNFVIEEKKRQDLSKLLKEYRREYSKNGNSQKTKQLAQEIKEFADKNFLSKKPTKVLEEVVKLKAAIAKNNDETAKNKLDIQIDALYSALKAAYQTKIEYQIMDEINSGAIYDFKKNVENHKCDLTDGSTIKILSDQGIDLMFNSLFNPTGTNPMGTINLLCEHTGLGDKFFKIITDKYDLIAINNHLNAFYQRILTIKKEAEIYSNIYDEIIKMNISDYQKALNLFEEKINERIPKHNKTMNSYFPVFKSVSEGLKGLCESIDQNADISEEKKIKIINGLLYSIHQKSLNAIVYDFQDRIQTFQQLSNEIEKGLDIITNFKINKFSPIYKKKKIFDQTFIKLQKLSEQILVETAKIFNRIVNEEVDGNIEIKI